MQGFEYHVDLVFCIDSTASMIPVLDEVKTNALRFHGDVLSALNAKGKHVDKMRIKVVAFRDLYDDMATAFEQSEFFSLPEEASRFETFVRKLQPIGGGDEPESGLEALALALNSEWTRGGAKRRHVVVLWTDASAHALEKASGVTGAPPGIPATFDDLTDFWQGQSADLSARRLILFAPEAQPWTTISEVWEGVVWVQSRAGSGLDELSHEEIVSTIVNSVGG